MKIQRIFKCLTAVMLTAMLCITADVMAKPKEKKEKITDPRLLTIMKMPKTTKESQFLSKGTALKTAHRAVQGFDVSNNEGTLWFSQPGTFGKSQPGLTKVHENYIIRVKNGKREAMTVNYFGNANNIAIESTPEGDYVWLGSCGTKWKGSYSRTRAVSRFLFEPGGTIDNGHAGETYYMGGERYVWAAVDAENDLLGITTQKAGVVSIFIYSLSEARTLPDTDIKVKTEWKGENIGEEQETVVLTLKGKDLTTLEPLSSFVVAKPDKDTGNPAKDVNYYTFRGFDVDKDYVYFIEGQHNKGNFKGNGESKAFITVFDHAGRVVLPRRRVGVIADQVLLELMGITSTDYADICGIQVDGNKAYIAFSAYNKDGQKKGHRACVVKYE